MNVKEFGTFNSTYRVTTYLLFCAMMYPNVNTVKRRLVGFALTTLAFLPMFLVLLFNVFDGLVKRDIYTLIHQSTVVGPYFGGLLKIAISNYRAFEGQSIIAEIDRDYAIYNTLPEKYHVIVRSWISNSRVYAERCWNSLVVTSGTLYMCTPIVLNIKSQFFDEFPQLVQIHDSIIPFVEPELRFETPYFEMTFGQCLIGVVLIILYYTGFESCLALALNHCCLKIEIYCEALVDALEVENINERLKAMEHVIKEQLRLLKYFKTVQRYFNIYLGVVLFATLIQIGTCLYLITANGKQDYQCYMLTIASVSTIYLPCYYASKLKQTANNSATKIYTAGWHKVYCNKTRKIILFMIQRAQVPVMLMGFNCIIFDMQMFLSILQSAYSIYTLLSS